MKNESKTGATSSELRQRLKEVMRKEIEHLPDLLEQLTPEDRAKTVIKLLPFFVPQVERVESSLDPFRMGAD